MEEIFNTSRFTSIVAKPLLAVIVLAGGLVGGLFVGGLASGSQGVSSCEALPYQWQRSEQIDFDREAQTVTLTWSPSEPTAKGSEETKEGALEEIAKTTTATISTNPDRCNDVDLSKYLQQLNDISEEMLYGDCVRLSQMAERAERQSNGVPEAASPEDGPRIPSPDRSTMEERDGRHVLLLPEDWEPPGKAAERKEDVIVSLDMDVVDRELQKCSEIFG